MLTWCLFAFSLSRFKVEMHWTQNVLSYVILHVALMLQCSVEGGKRLK